jgi:roadblock/LC7 domain-containing protein
MRLESNQAIKVLEVTPEDGSLWSCHGGFFQWDPPILKDDGSYTPGAWTPSVKPHLCDHGYHLTDDPGQWWDINNHCAFLVEYKGEVSGSFNDDWGRKIAVESCRLLRPLTAEELAGYNVFIEGVHTIKNANAYALGDATVFAHGNARVFVEGNALVVVYDNVKVFASGNARVFARDNTSVEATGKAVVNAEGNSAVTAMGNVTVNAYKNAEVFAYNSSKVNAYDNSVVTPLGGHWGVITRL